MLKAPQLSATDKYIWNYGDGSPLDTLTKGIANHTYPGLGKYFVNLKYNYCSINDTVSIRPKPIFSLPSDTTICPNITLKLDTKVDSANYKWNTGDSTSFINISTTGLYKVTVSNICNQVRDSTKLHVLTFTAAALPSSINICEGNTIPLNASTSFSHYIWNTGDTSAILNARDPGLYSVNIKNLCFSKKDTVLITLTPKPVTMALVPSIQICDGKEAFLNPGMDPLAKYQWSTGSTVAGLNVSQAGKYKVDISNGCFHASDSTSVTVIPQIILPFGTDTTLCEDSQVKLNAKNSNSNYTWNTGQQEQIIVVTTSGIYKVDIKNNCFEKQAVIHVKFLDWKSNLSNANIFTPNGDGVNDEWRPFAEPVVGYQLHIVNRWGVKVFETSNSSQPWTADLIPSGTYYYNISFQNCKNEEVSQKGFIEVAR